VRGVWTMDDSWGLVAGGWRYRRKTNDELLHSK
jgi:hypothetical protein